MNIVSSPSAPPKHVATGSLLIGRPLLMPILLFGLFAAMGVAFLFHSNGSATLGYDLKILQLERNALVAEGEVLSMEIADLSALSALQESPTTAQMVRAERPRFIRGDTLFASAAEGGHALAARSAD